MVRIPNTQYPKLPTILIAFRPDLIPDQRRARIEALAGDAEIVITEDKAQMEAVLADIEIAAGWLPREFLPRMPQLRWFQQYGAGVDWLLRHPEAIDLPFTLTNASGVHAIQISEHILALLLAFARRLPEAWRAQQQRAWQAPAGESLFELAGKTIVVVGMGPIGRRMAKLCTALGMRVWGVRRSAAKPEAGVEKMVGPEQLLAVLPLADFVVLAAPLTPQTLGMIGETALRALKPSAYLINIGRGGLVDEQALIRALQALSSRRNTYQRFCHRPRQGNHPHQDQSPTDDRQLHVPDIGIVDAIEGVGGTGPKLNRERERTGDDSGYARSGIGVVIQVRAALLHARRGQGEISYPLLRSALLPAT